MDRAGKLIAVVALAVLIAACSDDSANGPDETGAEATTVASTAPADACAPIEPVDGEATAGATPPAPSGTPDDTVTVDLDAPDLGPANQELIGLVWNTGDELDGFAPIQPPTVRVDASLQDASQGPDQLDLTNLLAKVAEIRSVGAEPLVLLSYMPAWLGQERAGADGDATRFAPADLDAWEDLVTEVVRTLATADEPAHLFEVWNEPDFPNFWQDTPESFVDTALRTHRAVAAVEEETGIPLEVGGPASAFRMSDDMLTYLRTVVDEGLPLDFVSWHRYANTPFLGPDGAEGNLDDPVYEQLAGVNPDATPLDYAEEIDEVRAAVEDALAGTGADPRFLIDEWNVSAGGLDLRHDSAEGAALVAGVLTEMERAGLDGADFYRALSGDDDEPGDWGMASHDGRPKPSWWVFRAWRAMAGDRLATTDAPRTGLWARATRGDGGCVDLLLANFVATGGAARDVEVRLDGTLPPCAGTRSATVARLDDGSTTLAAPSEVELGEAQELAVPMAAQSVALVRLGCVT